MKPRWRRLEIATALVVVSLCGAPSLATAQPPKEAPTSETSLVAEKSTDEATSSADEGESVVLSGAKQYTLRAKSGLDYRIYIAAPAGPAPESGFPVLYVTDGNSNFLPALAALRGRPSRSVLVAIGYPSEERAVHSERRYWDLTAPASEEWLAKQARERAPNRVGGQEEFFRFIEDEVKPFLAARHKLDSQRQALFGHSFGGHFVLHVLFAHPESFQTYIASSPSIWWADGAVLREEPAFVARLAEKPARVRLFVSIGEYEENFPPEMPEERRAVYIERRMAGHAREAVERLSKLSDRGVTATFHVFPEEDHGSVVTPALQRAIRATLERGGPPGAN